MSRPRRTARARRGLGRLSSWRVYSLCSYSGLDDVLGPAWLGGPEERAAAWELHGPAIASWWITPPTGEWPAFVLGAPDHVEPAGQPFYRPLAWWQFDAPEPRRCLACDGSLPIPGRDPHAATCRCGWDRVGESLAAYLSRVEMLLPGEQVTERDLEPEFLAQIPERGSDGKLQVIERAFRGGRLVEVARHQVGFPEHNEVWRHAFKFWTSAGDGVRPRPITAPLNQRAA